MPEEAEEEEGRAKVIFLSLMRGSFSLFVAVVCRVVVVVVVAVVVVVVETTFTFTCQWPG